MLIILRWHLFELAMSNVSLIDSFVWQDSSFL